MPRRVGARGEKGFERSDKISQQYKQIWWRGYGKIFSILRLKFRLFEYFFVVDFLRSLRPITSTPHSFLLHQSLVKARDRMEGHRRRIGMKVQIVGHPTFYSLIQYCGSAKWASPPPRRGSELRTRWMKVTNWPT